MEKENIRTTEMRLEERRKATDKEILNDGLELLFDELKGKGKINVNDYGVTVSYYNETLYVAKHDFIDFYRKCGGSFIELIKSYLFHHEYLDNFNSSLYFVKNEFNSAEKWKGLNNYLSAIKNKNAQKSVYTCMANMMNKMRTWHNGYEVLERKE